MLVFAGIFRQDSRSVLLISHFGWVIAQLEKQRIRLVMFYGARMSSKYLTVPDLDRFWGIAVKFREILNFRKF